MSVRRNKFNARKTSCAQCVKPHPSKAEAKRCDELHLLQRGGTISGLTCQPVYYFQLNGQTVKHPNGRRVCYTPDWSYTEAGKSYAEDCKGMRTEAFVTRIAFFRAFYPYLTLRETGK